MRTCLRSRQCSRSQLGGTVGGGGAVEFRVLGQVEVSSGGRPLRLGRAAGRRALGCAAGRGVAALRTQVSRLRKQLGAAVETSGRGYVLRIQPGELDLDRFRAVLAEAGAASEPGRRSALLREADGLWRGEALSGLDAPFAPTEAAVLEELRLAALEDRLDADLERGLDGELVSELSALIARYPLRERLRGQLILALYRSGRQADALEAYRQTRRVLDEQLGLEPSPSLRELERAILRHDPALAPAKRAAVAVPDLAPPSRKRPRLRMFAGLALAALAATGIAVAFATAGGNSDRTGADQKRVTVSDSFDSDYVDPTIWQEVRDGGDVAIAEQGGQLQLTVGPHAVPGGIYNQIDVHVGTQCSFPGNFDARVDYTLLEWPTGDNIDVGLNAIYANAAAMRDNSSQGGDEYSSWVIPSTGSVPLRDTSGSLRITRVNGVETTYFWHRGSWRTLASSTEAGAAVIGLQAFSDGHGAFGGREVKVAFDNFAVSGVNPICAQARRS
jgi:DNA-binding SARP family transcriptional activator